MGNARRWGGIAVIVLVGALALSSCQTARIGAACRTPGAWGENRDQILRCQGRKWVRVISKADYARLILAKLQQEQAAAVRSETTVRPPDSTPAIPPPPAPTTTTVPPPAPPAFNVLYVVPSDVDPDPNIPAAIRHELGQVSTWYRNQTATATTPGAAPRFARDPGGAITVTQVDIDEDTGLLGAAERLPGTDTGLFDAVRAALVARGHVVGEADLVYVDYQSDHAICGEAVMGLALIYLENQGPPDFTGCGRTNELAPSATNNDDTLVTTAHELAHALGATESCAPNHDDVHPFHVTDGDDWVPEFDPPGLRVVRQDILNADPDASLRLGDGVSRDLGFQLDWGRDDYYGHSIAGCTDIADSPYWE